MGEHLIWLLCPECTVTHRSGRYAVEDAEGGTAWCCSKACSDASVRRGGVRSIGEVRPVSWELEGGEDDDALPEGTDVWYGEGLDYP